MSIVCGSPNAIEVLLHHYVSPDPHPRENAPAVRDAQRILCQGGLLCLKCSEFPVEDPRLSAKRVYEVTGLGKAHVQQLCDLPAPKKVYVDHNGKQIKA